MSLESLTRPEPKRQAPQRLSAKEAVPRWVGGAPAGDLDVLCKKPCGFRSALVVVIGIEKRRGDARVKELILLLRLSEVCISVANRGEIATAGRSWSKDTKEAIALNPAHLPPVKLQLRQRHPTARVPRGTGSTRPVQARNSCAGLCVCGSQWPALRHGPSRVPLSPLQGPPKTRSLYACHPMACFSRHVSAHCSWPLVPGKYRLPVSPR